MNSRMQGFERDVMTSVINGKRVWLIQLVVNALLMTAFFYWTRIPEENGWLFSLTVVTGLLIAFMALWLHAATFDYFGAESHRPFMNSLRRSTSRVPAFLIWTMLFGLVLWLIAQLWTYDEQVGGWARHSLPLFLRRLITPRSVISASHWLVWFLYFILWPILFLPVGAHVASTGFRGFFRAPGFRPFRKRRFWIVYLVCFMVGAYLPYTLAGMTPTKPSSLNWQTWSMVLRLGLGYLLLVTAWLVLCASMMRASGGEDEIAAEAQPVPAGAAPVP